MLVHGSVSFQRMLKYVVRVNLSRTKQFMLQENQCDFLLGGKYSNIFKLFIWIFFLRFVI